jgi:DNA repair photolyase
VLEIIREERKSPILARPTLPCLSDAYTINLTAGCPFQCRYCYAQGYSNHPGEGRIKFYAGSAQRLAAELARKRRKPNLVYFSSATEPFMPIPDILEEQFSIMETLLASEISLLIMTKAKIPGQFLRLFSEHSSRVNVQVGLTTADDRVRALFEPNAAPVADRLWNVSSLAEIGVRVELRMDPLIPMLTDTDPSLRTLLGEAASLGRLEAIASFLHVRQANRKMMSIRFGEWDFDKVRQRLYSKTAQLGGCGCGMSLPSEDYRRERFGAIERIAGEFGIAVKYCACKNPDLVTGRCHDRFSCNEGQLNLFQQI